MGFTASLQSTKNIVEKTEDIRKALWDKNETIYQASSDSNYAKTSQPTDMKKPT